MPATYTCPLCGNEMSRDLELFMDHGQSHIIDQIKKEHPDWVSEDGVCKPCAAYYEQQLSGDPEIENIGPAGRQRRVITGIIALIIGFSQALALLATDVAALWRLTLVLPFFIGAWTISQAKGHTCSVLAELGTRNMDQGTEPIDCPDLKKAIRARGRKILAQSALIAFSVGILFYFFPT
jgi:hypothetical protein